jgi:hypothetical protein
LHGHALLLGNLCYVHLEMAGEHGAALRSSIGKSSDPCIAVEEYEIESYKENAFGDTDDIDVS